MKKGIQLKQMISFCLVVLMVFVMPLTCLAGPTIEDIENGNYTSLIMGKNIHRGSMEQDYLYRFVAPENGIYSLDLVNNGKCDITYYIYDDELTRIYVGGYKAFIHTDSTPLGCNSSYTPYERIELKKDESLYILFEPYSTGSAGYITITSLTPKKPVRTLSKTALSLRAGKQENLYFTGDKSKATWVSRDPAIATVSQNGVVTGKKKGVTFIYSIVNHKLYKTKVSVY